MLTNPFGVLAVESHPDEAEVLIFGQPIRFFVDKDGRLVKLAGPWIPDARAFDAAATKAREAILRKQEEAERKRLSENPHATTDEGIARTVLDMARQNDVSVWDALDAYRGRAVMLHPNEQPWRLLRIKAIIGQIGGEASAARAMRRKKAAAIAARAERQLKLSIV